MGQIDHKSMDWAFRAADLHNYYATKLVMTRPGPLPNAGLVRFVVLDGRERERVELPLPLTIERGVDYRVRVSVRGNRFLTSVNGQLISSWMDSRISRGGVGFFSEDGESSVLKWVSVSERDSFLARVVSHFSLITFPTAAGAGPSKARRARRQSASLFIEEVVTESFRMRRCRLWCLTLVALSLGAPPAGLAAVNPKLAEKSFREGLRLEEANQWKEAEAAYSEAILADPNGAAYYFHRARVRFFAGDYPQALEDAGSATRLEPKNGDAFLLLADIDGRMKNPRKAVAEYTRAIELGVNTAAVYNSRAAAHTQLREYEAAIADYTLGIKLRLDDPEPIRRRADLYNCTGPLSRRH